MKSTLISHKVNNWKLFLQNDPEPVKGIVDNPIEFFQENFSKKDFELFNLIIYAFNKYEQVYISQATLARWVGCSREHANRILAKLKDWGLISSYYRYKKSCFYKLSSFFADFYVRRSLSKLFKSFTFLTVIWLNSPLYASFAKKITLLNKRIIKKVDRTAICYFNCCQVLCACTYARVREENGTQKTGEKNLKHEVLNRLSEKLGLTRDDLDRLKNYDDDILLKAEDVLKKKTPANPAGYLFGICKQEQSRKDQAESKKENSYKAKLQSSQVIQKENIQHRKQEELRQILWHEKNKQQQELNEKSWMMTSREAESKYEKAHLIQNQFYRNILLETLSQKIKIIDSI